MKLAMVLGAAAIFATSAAAESWQKVGETDGEFWFASRATLRTVGKLRQAWTLVNYLEPRRSGAKLGSPGLEYQSRKFLYHIDCETYSLGVKAGALFAGLDGHGDAIESFEYKEAELTAAFPDSIGELMTNWACAKPATSKTKRPSK